MDSSSPEEDPNIADARFLLGASSPTGPRSAEPAPTPDGPEAYDLEAPSPSSPAPSRPKMTPIADDAPPEPIVERPRGERERPRRPASQEPSDDVGTVWTRGAEWGPDLFRLAIGLLVYLFILYSTFSLDRLGLWVLLGLAGLATLGLISYPILITLERPVRITPEQAIKDYYEQLAHMFPHYRRMWLLLSDSGKEEFGGFAEFRAFWKERLGEWKGRSDKPGGLLAVPSVRVVDFRSEGKSAGVSEIEGTFGIRVVDKGGATLFAGARNVDLVRGADRMWYLASGRPPKG